MLPTRLALVLPLLAVAACSDDGANSNGGPDACVDPAATTAPDGLVSSPAEFERDGCEPGSLAGVDLSGLWYMEEENQGLFSGGGPVRFSLDCGGFNVKRSGIASTFDAGYTLLTDDDVFWRDRRVFQMGDLVFTDSFDVCRADADGSLFGRAMHCFESIDFGDDCSSNDIVLRRFERLPGETESRGLTLVSEWSGSAASPWPDGFTANVRVHKGIAYLARGSDGLRIVDVSDPASPSDLGRFGRGEDDFNDVKIVERADGAVFALMASNSTGTVIVDVSDPRAPTLATVFTPSGDPMHGVHSLFVETIGNETRAYLADGFTEVLVIYDVTNPALPNKIGEYKAADEDWKFHDLFVENGRAYINATEGGLIIVDTLASPQAPVLVGRYPGGVGYSHSNWVTSVGGRIVSATGDEGYTAHLEIIDVDPTSGEFATKLGELTLRPEVSIHNIVAFDDRVYASHYQDGVRIFDISDLANPSVVSYFNTWDPENAPGAKFEGAVGIDVDRDAGLIYVADTPRGLLILSEQATP